MSVSLNTPLCSLNRDYLATVRFAEELGVRYLTCSGLIPAGNATTDASRAERLSPDELVAVLRPAIEYATAHGMEINFTSPGWLPEETLRALGFTQIPSCGGLPVQHGHCTGRHRTALPELAVWPGAGQSAAYPLAPHLAQPGLLHHPQHQRRHGAPLPTGRNAPAGGLPMTRFSFVRRAALWLAVLLCCVVLALPAGAAGTELAPYAEEGDLDYIRSYVVTVDLRQDGSADITYDIDWQVLGGDATQYLSWVKIGLPNAHAEDLTPLTDTIADLQYTDDGGSYAKVVFSRRYYSPEVAARTAAKATSSLPFRSIRVICSPAMMTVPPISPLLPAGSMT